MADTSIGRGVVTIGADTSSLAGEVSSGVAGQAGAISSAFGGLGKAAGAAFAAAAALGIAAVAGLAKIGSSFDDAYDSLRVQTGKTGEALAGLQGDFKAVVSSVPADFGDASTAIGTLSQKLGLTGAPLQSLSEQVLNLSRITKTDLGTNVKATADLFTSWGTAAADQGPKLDELFRLSQQTGVSVGDLAQQMTDGGVQFRQAGLTFESTGALLGLLGKNGLSASDVLPALSKSMAQAAKDGKDAGTVFQDTFAAIKNAPNDTAAAGIALDVFGAKAGPKFAALIREGKLSYEDLAATIAGGGDTINQASADTADWSEKLKLLTNKALLFLEPIATKVFNAIGTVVEYITPYVQKITAWLGTHLPVAIATVRTWIVDHLVPAFRAVVAWIVDHWPQISAVFVAVWDGIKKAAMFVIDTVVPAVIAGFKWVVDWVVDHWDQISAVVVGVFDAVKKAVLYVVEEVFPKIVAGFKTAFGWLMDNKEVLIGVAAAIAVGLAALFVSWAAGAASAAAATLAAAAPFIAIGVAIAGVVAGVLYAYNHFKTFHDIVDKVGRVIKQVTGWLLEHKIVLAGIAVAIGLLVAPIPTLIAGIIYAWTHFQRFRDVVLAVVDAVKVAIAAVTTWIKAHWDQIKADTENVFNVISTLVHTYVDVWTAIIKGAIATIQFIWDNFGTYIVDGIQASWTIISGIFQLAFDTIVGIFDFFRDLFTGKWGKLWGDVTQVVTDVWDGIKGIISGVLAAIGVVLDVAWTAIKLAADAAWSLLKTAADTAWGLVKLAVTAPIDAAKAALDLIWTALASAAQTVWNAFQTAADTAWGAIKTAVTAPIDAAKAAIDATWSALSTAASSVWSALKTAADTAWDLIKTAVTMPITAAKAAIDLIWSAISGAASTAWDAIKGAADTAWAKIKEAIMFPINVARDLIASVWTTITTAAGTAWSGIETAAGKAWDLIKTAVMTPINSAKDLISGIWDGIVDTITKLPGRVASAASGMWDGIKQAFKDAINGIIGLWDNFAFPTLKVPSIPTPFGDIGGWSFGGWHLPHINPLALGGVITGPTYALMGEYPGASSNPEIVSPRNIMADTFSAVIDGRSSPQFPSVMRLVLEDGRELRGYVEEVADGQVLGRERQLVGALQAGQRR